MSDGNRAHITKEEIRAITDPAEITALIDELRTNVAQIETQLEWREGDDAWEARAIGALGMQRSALGEAIRQERRVTGKTAEHQKAEADNRLAKALKKEAAAARHMLDMEERKLRHAKRRAELGERAMNVIEQTSRDAAFRRAARKMLDSDTFDAIEAAADKQVLGAIRSFVNEAAA